MKKPWFRVQLFEIAVINTLIWHSFLLPRCQQTQEFKTRSDEENGETCHLALQRPLTRFSINSVVGLHGTLAQNCLIIDRL